MRADTSQENIGASDPFVHSYRTVPLRHGPVREPISIVNGGADKAAAKDPVAAESTPTEEMKSDVSDIHHYAQAGDVKEVRRCLLNRLNGVDQVDELGCTAVHLAGAMGHADVVKLLVEEHGALVDARDGALCTALHAASEGGHPVVVELLLRLGADINARNGKEQTPLHYACGYGQVEAAQQLTLRGASTGARDIQGNTPLHLACCSGGNDIVRLLVNNGSPLKALNNRGRRPLHLACRSGHLDIAITLLENGADPSARDANGMQAIDMIGAKRRIPQGIRFDLINTLERYQLGEFALARPPSSSAGSLRQMWKDREDATRLSGASSEGLGSRSSSFVKGASPREGLSTCSSGGRGRGFGGVGARTQHHQPRERGIGTESGRSPRWALGAAVAGRLEEMRARELGASLRAKVQENEAMKRYLDSVKEEMRMLQEKISEQSSARSSPSVDDVSSFGVRGSIAEQVAHTMYGSEGIGGLSAQDMMEAGARADAALGAMGKGVRRGVASGVFTGDVPRPAMAAPFHAGTEDVTEPSVVVDGRPSSEEMFTSDGENCTEQHTGVGPSPVSMSKLLMAKRAQLQSLLGVQQQPGQA